MKIGEKILAIRKELKLTQAALGAHMGITRAAVSQMELGDFAVSIHRWRQVGELYGMTDDEMEHAYSTFTDEPIPKDAPVGALLLASGELITALRAQLADKERTIQLLMAQLKGLPKQPPAAPVPAPTKPVFLRDIDDMSYRLLNVLKGIKELGHNYPSGSFGNFWKSEATLQSVAEYGLKKLNKERNFGTVSRNEILSLFNQYGLTMHP